MIDIQNFDLTCRNTFGIKASCRRFVEFGSVDELRAVLATLDDKDKPLFVLGGGSNVLFTGDFDGVILHSAITGIEAHENSDCVLLRVGSGIVWDNLVALCVNRGWYGAENLSLIPGEVGASAVQNIGAYGVEAKDIIEEVEAVSINDGSLVTIPASACGYAYRQSRFKKELAGRYVITRVTYRLAKSFKPNLDYGNIRAELLRRGISEPTAPQLRQVIIDIRNSKLPDPKVTGNAGSFFMNPVVGRQKYEELVAEYPQMPHYTIDSDHEKIPAGWLIEQCGWKGRELGRVGVHSKQALVLVNLGGATGQDVIRLYESVQKDVNNKFGIEIRPEVNIV